MNVSNDNRKRKGADPTAAPAPKRGPAELAHQTRPSIETCVPPEELEIWKSAAAEMNWTPADCLLHKLSFPKRCDAAKKVDTLVAHLKRLRAAGWYLHDVRDQLQSQVDELDVVLQAEKSARKTENEVAQEAAELARLRLEQVQEKVDAAAAEAERRLTELRSVKKELGEAEAKVREAEATVTRLSTDLTAQTAASDALERRLQSSETTVTETQKYNSHLQEYNARLLADLAASSEAVNSLREEKAAVLEEVAGLRGRVSALGDALSALQAASDSAETARQAAAEDLARVRADLAISTEEKNTLNNDFFRLRAEAEEQRRDLGRFRAVTGRDLAALEAERASSAVLTSRTEAQAATVAALQDQISLLKEQKTAAEARADAKCGESKGLTARVAQLEVLLAAAEERVREGEAVRRRLHNTILELKGNVRVFCRVRPLSHSESTSAVAVMDRNSGGELAGRGLEISSSSGNGGGNSSKTSNPQKYSFAFDKVFGPSASQADVFEEVSALVQSALDGYRVCIFAYGQTNAGKTHTMLGRPGGEEDEGIIPRAVRQVFASAAAATAQGWRYEMKAAMLEIYNEEIRDLIGKGPPDGKKHVISHEDKDKGGTTSVAYLDWVTVDDESRVATLLRRAMSQRAVGATSCNEQSSRSHMVFMLTIEGTNDATGQRLTGVVNLVDLAGSERLAKSGAVGDRLKETQAINKSLSALGDVISALGARDAHVPYRNSKLTYLLQNSLGGAGKALMLCNVSPAVENAAESLCTLRFAAKVNATEIGTARRNISAK